MSVIFCRSLEFKDSAKFGVHCITQSLRGAAKAKGRMNCVGRFVSPCHIQIFFGPGEEGSPGTRPRQEE